MVETDGLRYHRTAAQQLEDRRRDQAHAAAGLLKALRFTHAQVRFHPNHVQATLEAVIRIRPWKEVPLDESRLPLETATFVACIATTSASAPEDIPDPTPEEDPAKGWTILRWLGGRALLVVPVVDPSSFAWAGPWIARIRADGAAPRAVVMYGIPSGVAWDPSGVTDTEGWEIEDGFVVAPLDVALAPPGAGGRPRLQSGRV